MISGWILEQCSLNFIFVWVDHSFLLNERKGVCQFYTFTPSAETVAFEQLSTERSYEPQTNTSLFISGLERNMKCRSTSWNAYRPQCASNFRVFSEYKLEEGLPSGPIKKNNHTQKNWVMWKNCRWSVHCFLCGQGTACLRQWFSHPECTRFIIQWDIKGNRQQWSSQRKVGYITAD